MNLGAENQPASLFGGGQSIRTTLAYSVMMLGLAGSLALAPLLIWAIAAHGFH